MRLVLFLLASYGLTNVVTLGRVTRPFREWLARTSPRAGYWVRCPMCFGFAVGAAWSLAGLAPGTGLAPALDALAGASIASGWCWTMRVVLHRLGEDTL